MEELAACLVPAPKQVDSGSDHQKKTIFECDIFIPGLDSMIIRRPRRIPTSLLDIILRISKLLLRASMGAANALSLRSLFLDLFGDPRVSLVALEF